MPHPVTNKILNIVAEHRRIPEDEKTSHNEAEFSAKAI